MRSQPARKPMSRLLTTLLTLILLLSGCGRQAQPTSADTSSDQSVQKEEATGEEDLFAELWQAEDTVRALILSDLHYTGYRGVDNAVVPGMALAEEITDAIVEEVIEIHPDVLVLTGDNTDSGDRYDAENLAGKLERVREAGIRIILTTGNHDMNRMDAADFEEVYYGLVEATDRDPASLSYTVVTDQVVWLAMDDNAVHPGGQGEFSAATMEWLEQILDRYRGRTIIWLSHHSVLYGRGADQSAGYLIQNPELPDLLRRGGVRLAFTGHLHFQYILEMDGLYEVISAMPFSGRHLMGRLAIGKGAAGTPRQISFRAMPLALDKYAPEAADQLAEMDRQSRQFQKQTFEHILDKEKVNAYEQRRILDLLDRFFLYYGEGVLGEHAAEIRNDPAYRRMLEVLQDYNYGPWIRSMAETTRLGGRALDILTEEK